MKLVKAVATLATTAAIAGGVGLASTGTALADYGQGALHQVEISANLAPNAFSPGTGGGIWLWLELDGSPSGGTGSYRGSDCLHRTPFIGPTGAVADSGGVMWTSDGSTITITGVVIGGDLPVTITVPQSGHETTSLAAVFSTPVSLLPGTANVEVAP